MNGNRLPNGFMMNMFVCCLKQAFHEEKVLAVVLVGFSIAIAVDVRRRRHSLLLVLPVDYTATAASFVRLIGNHQLV